MVKGAGRGSSLKKPLLRLLDSFQGVYYTAGDRLSKLLHHLVPDWTEANIKTVHERLQTEQGFDVGEDALILHPRVCGLKVRLKNFHTNSF